MTATSPCTRAVRIAIVAGETSGDRLAAGLIRAIKTRAPQSQFVGVGGPRMAEAGCEMLHSIADLGVMGVIGLDGLLRQLPRIVKLRRSLARRFTVMQPDLFVGVDAPDFNLSLARALKKNGITCAHYVSPTLWAWRGYRIHKIRRSIHHMLTLFPFEADYYRAHEVPVTCVGHPMADEIAAPDRARARERLKLGADEKWIALLPGSRRNEIRRHGGVFVDAARLILNAHPDAKFILPFADRTAAQEFKRVTVGKLTGIPLQTLGGDDGADGMHNDARLALEAADVAILASGTAALEAALLRRAHVVVYKLAPLSYWLMRRLRHVDYYSMPNQLLPTPMIPELIQQHATAANIARETNALLGAPQRVAELQRHFADLHRELRRDANARAADKCLQLARG